MTVRDAAYWSEWAPFERDPGPVLVLLGCQRSGTTLLHLQLARTGAFRFLTAYEVTASDRLVDDARRDGGQAARADFAARIAINARDRGIDAVPAGPDTPEEYGLVIARGAPPRLRYEHPDTTLATLSALRELCAKKALLEGRARPLLLKSPPDYPGGIGLLAEAFPTARFLAIARHPLVTLDSQARAWRSAVSRRHPYLAAVDAGYRSLFEDAGRHMTVGMFLHSEAGMTWFAECILAAHLGFLAVRPGLAGRLLTLRYEDLCADQSTELRRIGEFLGIELQEPRERPMPRDRTVSEEAQRVYGERRERFAPYLEAFGYKAEIS